MAFNWTRKSSRRVYGEAVRVVVVHTAEGIRDADDLVEYFTRSDVDASCHECADDDKRRPAVPYARAAWTLLSGNAISDNLELCGFAEWSRDEWLQEHMGMIRNAAAWIAERCAARGIPCVKLTPKQLRAGQSGVIGHVDWSVGMRDGDHWDPGPGFPWDVVMGIAAGNTPLEVNRDEYLMGLSQYDQELVKNATVDINNRTTDMKLEIDALKVQVDALTAKLGVPGAVYDWLPALNNKLDAIETTLAKLAK